MAFLLRLRFVLLMLVVALYMHHIEGDVLYSSTRLSSRRTSFSSIEADGLLYFAGGFEFHDNIATDVIQVFDLANQTWGESLRLPHPRGFVSPVVLDPNIYFIGGWDYENSIAVYNTSTHQFDLLEQGPTVFTPRRLSVHGSLLTVIGYASVDFYDFETQQWNYSAALTDVVAPLFNSIVFAVEDLVVVIGGRNLLTDEDVATAWIYNHTSGSLDEFSDAVNGTISDNAANNFDFSMAHGVLTVWAEGLLFVHRLDTDDWSQLTGVNFFSAVSLPTATFAFTIDGWVVYDWAGPPESNPSRSYLRGFIYAFAVDGYLVYLSVERTGTGINIYNLGSQSWEKVQTVLMPIADINFGAPLQTRFVFANLNNVYFYEPSTNSFDFVPFSVKKIIMADASVFVFDTPVSGTGKQMEIVPTPGGVIMYNNTASMMPVALVGDDFVNLRGESGLNRDTSTVTPLNLEFKYINVWTANNERMVVMTLWSFDGGLTRQLYNKMDVYNYRERTWRNASIELPESLNATWSLDGQHLAASVDGKVLVWVYSTLAIYDPLTDEWTSQENHRALEDTRGNGGVHVPVLVVNNTAYCRPMLQQFTRLFAKFTPPSFDESDTSSAPVITVDGDSTTRFKQYVSYQDQLMFISSSIGVGRAIQDDTIFIYNIPKDEWDITKVPGNTSQYSVTITIVSDFLVAFVGDTLSYYDIKQRTWFMQPFDNKIRPATVIQTSFGLTVAAGGSTMAGKYLDAVLIFSDDNIAAPPIAPVAVIVSPVEGPAEGLTDGQIAAIAVCLGVAAAAAVLLAVLLTRRKKRRQGRNTSMAGLEAKYGQWYTPFNQIKFGPQLGQGANGQVFKGTWKNTTVALKVSMTQANTTVIDELELMINLRPHPHVVQLFGFSVHPETDSIILIIEHCDGGSLDGVLFDSGQPITIEQKVTWLLGIAKGLSHLHTNNIVHRDVAARNVLLHQGEPKITDFGMSRLVDEEKQRGTTKSDLGPIRWMAPESLKIKEYSSKSDVWSFGILMYEVLFQTEPHINADPIEVGRLIRDQGLTPDVPASCPAALASLMEKCWQLIPAGRPEFDCIVQTLEQC